MGDSIFEDSSTHPDLETCAAEADLYKILASY